MKRLSLIAIFLLLIISVSAAAHSGGTDSSGGHHVSGTGEYHYHHGYPAHQHENGVCPYIEAEKKKEQRETFLLWATIACGAGIGIYYLLRLRKEKVDHAFKVEQEKCMELYLGKNLLEMVNMPEDTVLGVDKLPKEHGSQGWGEKYTMYVFHEGSAVFHRKGCRRAKIPVNAYTVSRYTPCRKCKPVLPEMAWYTKYRNILKKKKRYGIDCEYDLLPNAAVEKRTFSEKIKSIFESINRIGGKSSKYIWGMLIMLIIEVIILVIQQVWK